LDQWARDHKRRKLKELRAKRKYRLKFRRILTPKFTKDVDSLRHLDVRIRGLLVDGAVREMNDAIDVGFMGESAQAPTA